MRKSHTKTSMFLLCRRRLQRPRFGAQFAQALIEINVQVSGGMFPCWFPGKYNAARHKKHADSPDKRSQPDPQRYVFVKTPPELNQRSFYAKSSI
jgi:hypothetical protein